MRGVATTCERLSAADLAVRVCVCACTFEIDKTF